MRSWRQRFASLRVRIVAWNVLALTLALGLALAAAAAVLHTRLDERIDRELRQEAAELRALSGGRDPSTGQPFHGDVARILEVFLQRSIPAQHETFVAYLEGEPYLRSRDEPPVRLDQLPELTERWAEVGETERGTLQLEEVGTVAYQALPLRVDGDTRAVFVSAWFRNAEAAEINASLAVAAVIGGVFLVFAAWIVWNAATRVLRPVQEVGDTARAISSSDLTRRIEVSGSDEVAVLAATFNDMLDRLEAAFADQRRFLDDASHELRTPITIARGHLELLHLGDAEERDATVALVLDELDRMRRLVEDLLLLARAGRPDFVRRSIHSSAELTREVLRKATALAQDREWVLDSADDVPVSVDEQRLTQALVQLCDNAVRHAGPAAQIGVGCRADIDEVVWWVRDDGLGVGPADRERIFTRLTRGEGAGRVEGYGLGLAIVAAIAEAHGGHAALDAHDGPGARFTVAVPRSAPAEPATADVGGVGSQPGAPTVRTRRPSRVGPR
jgi:two-component system, OmpR family, sensor kinase